MDKMTERFDCPDERLKKALKILTMGEGYSQFFSARVKDATGLRTPDDSSIRVTVKDGIVTAEMLSAGPAAVGTLGAFFSDLHRSLGTPEKPTPAKTPVKERPTERIAPQAASEPVLDLTERVALIRANVSGSVKAALSTMIPVKLTLIVALIVMLISMLIGGGIGYAMRNPVEQPEYMQMVKAKDGDISVLNDQLSTVKDKADSLRSTVDELQPYKDEYDKKQSELSAQKAELEKRKAELDKQKTDQESKQKELDQRSSELDSRESAVQQRESAAASTPSYADSGSSGYSSGSSSDSGSGGYAYYKNCAAARAAGAAPLYRGQPGYRSALDRDNDGIACEWS